MSFSFDDVEIALAARLGTDATLTPLIQDVYVAVADRDADQGLSAKPYVVIDVVNAEHSDAFADNIAEITFEVWHIDSKANGAVPLTAVRNRTFGDWRANRDTTGVPSYGLHRYALTLSGDNVGGTCMRLSMDARHSDSMLAYVDTYQLIVTEGTS